MGRSPPQRLQTWEGQPCRLNVCPQSSSRSLRSGHMTSQLRASVDSNRVARYPAGVVGGEKGDDIPDFGRLSEALQSLHPKRDIATRIRLREVARMPR